MHLWFVCLTKPFSFFNPLYFFLYYLFWRFSGEVVLIFCYVFFNYTLKKSIIWSLFAYYYKFCLLLSSFKNPILKLFKAIDQILKINKKIGTEIEEKMLL